MHPVWTCRTDGGNFRIAVRVDVGTWGHGDVGTKPEGVGVPIPLCFLALPLRAAYFPHT